MICCKNGDIEINTNKRKLNTSKTAILLRNNISTSSCSYIKEIVLIFHDLQTARSDPSRLGVMDEICLPLWGAFPTQNMQNPSKI